MDDYTSLLTRATPPEILFSDDLAIMLGVSTAEADEEARSGRLGPPFFVHGRVAILREDLLNLIRVRTAAAECGNREVLP